MLKAEEVDKLLAEAKQNRLDENRKHRMNLIVTFLCGLLVLTIADGRVLSGLKAMVAIIPDKSLDPPMPERMLSLFLNRTPIWFMNTNIVIDMYKEKSPEPNPTEQTPIEGLFIPPEYQSFCDVHNISYFLAPDDKPFCDFNGTSYFLAPDNHSIFQSICDVHNISYFLAPDNQPFLDFNGTSYFLALNNNYMFGALKDLKNHQSNFTRNNTGNKTSDPVSEENNDTSQKKTGSDGSDHKPQNSPLPAVNMTLVNELLVDLRNTACYGLLSFAFLVVAVGN